MQEDFHYYATYCAAYLAGYSHKESMDICYSAQFVDLCSKTLLSKLKAPAQAATTQLQLEMMDARTDIIGLQDITRIWASFHFLPKDLYAERKKRTKRYMNKFRLICGPNGSLVTDTVKLAKDRPLMSVGIAMHVLADTWAHSNFAGTPSLVINNTVNDFIEILDKDGRQEERKIHFRHNPSAPDDLEQGSFINSVFQRSENSIMSLGHGRAGHLPDYSFIRYRYMPAWGEYSVIEKDNPSDYMHAFSQMIYAMQYLRGERDSFETGCYADEVTGQYRERIDRILRERRLDASDDWKELGSFLSGQNIEDFDIEKHQEEYMNAPDSDKENTWLGQFFKGAIAHKGMVCDRIFRSGNILAGFVKGENI
ncbi:MAG: hypothetical protein J5842_03170 [Lachnospiraceae bacterium]|nr:hypothetical protein [Lachnospiraceae bacterium]